MKLRHIVMGLAPTLVFVASCEDDAKPLGAAELPVAEAAASAPAADTERSETDPGEAAPAGEETIGQAPASERERERRDLFLPGPTLAGWAPSFYGLPAPLERAPEGYTHLAVVTGRQVGLFAKIGDRWPSGIARTGNRLPARLASGGSGCSGGEWYEVSGGHYLCSNQGVHITDEAVTANYFMSVTNELQRTRLPRDSQPNLFKHGVAKDGAPFLRRLPSEAELAAIREGNVPSELVNLHADGAYVLAFTQELEAHGEPYFQTIYGSYIRASDVKPRPLYPMHGERLDGDNELPIAFSWRESVLFCLDEDAPRPCGTAAKHTRFRSEGTIERDGEEYVLMSEGLGVPREDLRIATSIERPAEYGSSDKWIHIDLTEQVMLAYEGDTPIFATLISSGREGFHTPTGQYRVDRKYHSKTMRGTGGDGRPYQVQEVPWALYYDGNYAAHGAYWHNNFGQPASHGCVNIPPLDARWIYYWGDYELPEGWHAAKYQVGTRIHITGQTPDPVEEERA